MKERIQITVSGIGRGTELSDDVHHALQQVLIRHGYTDAEHTATEVTQKFVYEKVSK